MQKVSYLSPYSPNPHNFLMISWYTFPIASLVPPRLFQILPVPAEHHSTSAPAVGTQTKISSWPQMASQLPQSNAVSMFFSRHLIPGCGSNKAHPWDSLAGACWAGSSHSDAVSHLSLQSPSITKHLKKNFYTSFQNVPGGRKTTSIEAITSMTDYKRKC